MIMHKSRLMGWIYSNINNNSVNSNRGISLYRNSKYICNSRISGIIILILLVGLTLITTLYK